MFVKTTHEIIVQCAKCMEYYKVKSAQEGAVSMIWIRVEPHSCKEEKDDDK